MESAQHWIETLGLRPHPEGGFFRETYRASGEIGRCCLPAGTSGARAFSTAIYFLLPGGQVSVFHRIRSDEMWHFYRGDTLTVHVIDADGSYEARKLGPEPGAGFQTVVPAGAWFGASVDDPGSWSLAGCTVAPGFDFADFEMASREELQQRHPQHSAVIERLTR